MSQENNVHDLRGPVQFTIDGQPFSTTDRRQPAAALLRLAGLDPAVYDLGELYGQSPQTRRFADDEIVTIRPKARFVSIRQSADVA
jgi:hypothetical protein